MLIAFSFRFVKAIIRYQFFQNNDLFSSIIDLFSYSSVNHNDGRIKIIEAPIADGEQDVPPAVFKGQGQNFFH